MKSSYSSSTVTDDQKYNSADPPPVSSYSSSTVTDDQKYNSADPPPPPLSSYSSSTVTDDQKYNSADPPPRSSYSSSTVADDQKYNSADPQPPSSEQTPPETEVPWSTGLFSCFDDVPSCFLTFCCPRITIARIAAIVDKREISSCFCHCDHLNWYRYRSKLRQQYSLKEDPCNDFSVHFYCQQCALCQEYRELKHRGFDMSIGWQGNVEKQQVELAKAPVVQEGMTR